MSNQIRRTPYNALLMSLLPALGGLGIINMVLKFDEDSHSKPEIINYDVDT